MLLPYPGCYTPTVLSNTIFWLSCGYTNNTIILLFKQEQRCIMAQTFLLLNLEKLWPPLPSPLPCVPCSNSFILNINKHTLLSRWFGVHKGLSIIMHFGGIRGGVLIFAMMGVYNYVVGPVVQIWIMYKVLWPYINKALGFGLCGLLCIFHHSRQIWKLCSFRQVCYAMWHAPGTKLNMLVLL